MKNIASTIVISFGLIASLASNVSPQIFTTVPPAYSLKFSANDSQNDTFNDQINNFLKHKNSLNEFLLQKKAKEIFGEMRDATAEEQENTQKIIEKRMEPTGLNFWD